MNSQLVIHRHKARYFVQPGTGSPEIMRRRLDRICREHLPTACAQRLSSAFPAVDASVLLIPKLKLELVVDPKEASDLSLGEGWAGAIARALMRALASRGVRRFENRAEWYADSVCTLLAQAPSRRWDLGAVSPAAGSFSDAVQGLLGRDPEELPRVLRELRRRGRLTAMLQRLDPDHLHGLVASQTPGFRFRLERPPPSVRTWLRRLRNESQRKSRLAVALQLLSDLGAKANEDRVALCEAALWLEEWRSLVARAGNRENLLKALPLAFRFVQPVGPADRTGAEMDSSAEVEEPWVRRLVEEEFDRSRNGPRGMALRSPCAAVFLLLPTWLDADFESLLVEIASTSGLVNDEDEGAPGHDEVVGWLRTVVWGWCLTGDDSGRADPAVRLAAFGDLEPRWQPSPSQARGLSQAAARDAEDVSTGEPGDDLERELGTALLRRFARRLSGFDKSSIPHLRRNFLVGGGAVRWFDDRAEVALDATPLAIVLRMSGGSMWRYLVPWLGGRQIVVSVGDAARRE